MSAWLGGAVIHRVKSGAVHGTTTVQDASIGKKSVVIDVEKDANGLVTSVAVRKGTEASAADIALYEKVADMVARDAAREQGRFETSFFNARLASRCGYVVR